MLSFCQLEVLSALKEKDVPELGIGDKEGAAMSLLRLQETFRIPTDNMSLGDIHGKLKLL